MKYLFFFFLIFGLIFANPFASSNIDKNVKKEEYKSKHIVAEKTKKSKKENKNIDQETSKTKIKKYKIKAIIANFAFINNSWYELGTKIDDFKISKIDENTIFFQSTDQNLTIEIGNEF